MDYEKYVRERYDVTIEEMSSLSGLSVQRIEEIESPPHRKGTGRYFYTSEEIADRERLGAALLGVKNSQDETLVKIIGQLIKSNFSVSVDVESAPGMCEVFSARIKREFSRGSLTVEGRGNSRLKAMSRAMGHMSDAIAAVSGVMPEGAA